MRGYDLEYIEKMRIHELRDYARQIGIASPTTMKKEVLIEKIHEILDNKETGIKVENNSPESLDFFSLLTSPNSNIINDLIFKSNKSKEDNVKTNDNLDLSNTLVMKKNTVVNPNTPYAYSANDFVSFNFNLRQNPASYGDEVDELDGYLDINPNGFGIVRYSGFVPDSRDAYLTLALIKKFNLKKGDFVRGKVKYFLENRPKIMFDIISVNDNTNDHKNMSFDDYSYKRCGSNFYLDKFNLKIARGERLYLNNLGIQDAVKLGFDLVDENGVNVKLINLKALPEECFESHQKMQVINCPFNKTENDVVSTIELVLERVKREFEVNKSNVIIIYNFSEMIRLFNVAIEGFYSYEKFNAKAINQLTNIMYTAKYFDEKKNVTIICIDRSEIPEDIKTLVKAEFLPLFNKIIDCSNIGESENN